MTWAYDISKLGQREPKKGFFMLCFMKIPENCRCCVAFFESKFTWRALVGGKPGTAISRLASAYRPRRCIDLMGLRNLADADREIGGPGETGSTPLFQYRRRRRRERRASPPRRSSPPLMLRIFSLQLLLELGIRLLPEGREVLGHLDGPLVWRQHLDHQRHRPAAMVRLPSTPYSSWIRAAITGAALGA